MSKVPAELARFGDAFRGRTFESVAEMRQWVSARTESILQTAHAEAETARHVSAAADRWREALERIAAFTLTPAQANLPLSALPEVVRDGVRRANDEIRHVQARLEEAQGLYLSETRAKRGAQIERDRAIRDADTFRSLMNEVRGLLTFTGKEGPDPWRAVVVRVGQYVEMLDRHREERDDARSKLWALCDRVLAEQGSTSCAIEARRWLTATGFRAIARADEGPSAMTVQTTWRIDEAVTGAGARPTLRHLANATPSLSPQLRTLLNAIADRLDAL